MTLVIPPGFAQCVYRFSLVGDADTMMTSVGLDVSGAAGDFQDVADTAESAFALNFTEDGLGANWHFDGVTLTVGQDGGPPLVFEADTGLQGVSADPRPPQNIAVLVRKRTALGGRSGRGRMYLPPFTLSEANVTDNGSLDPDFRHDINLVIDSWMDDTPGDKVILHSDTAPGDPVPTVITSFVVDAKVATQRRRLR